MAGELAKSTRALLESEAECAICCNEVSEDDRGRPRLIIIGRLSKHTFFVRPARAPLAARPVSQPPRERDARPLSARSLKCGARLEGSRSVAPRKALHTRPRCRGACRDGARAHAARPFPSLKRKQPHVTQNTPPIGPRQSLLPSLRPRRLLQLRRRAARQEHLPPGPRRALPFLPLLCRPLCRRRRRGRRRSGQRQRQQHHRLRPSNSRPPRRVFGGGQHGGQVGRGEPRAQPRG